MTQNYLGVCLAMGSVRSQNRTGQAASSVDTSILIYPETIIYIFFFSVGVLKLVWSQKK